MEFRNFLWRDVCLTLHWREVFARRADQEAVLVSYCTLSGRVETAQGVYFIAKKLDAERLRFGVGPKIENATATRKLTSGNYRIDGFESEHHQVAGECFWLDDLTGFEVVRGLKEIAPWHCARHQGSRRNDNNRRCFRDR